MVAVPTAMIMSPCGRVGDIGDRNPDRVVLREHLAQAVSKAIVAPRDCPEVHPEHLRVAVGLLAYLAVTAEPHSRDELAELLFSEQGREYARSNLRQSLSLLGSAIGADRHGAWLRSGGGLWIRLVKTLRVHDVVHGRLWSAQKPKRSILAMSWRIRFHTFLTGQIHCAYTSRTLLPPKPLAAVLVVQLEPPLVEIEIPPPKVPA